jgi:hypothetical protein
MLTETILRIPLSLTGLVSYPPWLQRNLQDLLVTGGFRDDFTGSQAASSVHFQGQNRSFRVFFNLEVISQERLK